MGDLSRAGCPGRYLLARASPQKRESWVGACDQSLKFFGDHWTIQDCRSQYRQQCHRSVFWFQPRAV